MLCMEQNEIGASGYDFACGYRLRRFLKLIRLLMFLECANRS